MVHSVESKCNTGFQEVKYEKFNLLSAPPHQISTISSVEQIKKNSPFTRLFKAQLSLLNSLWKKLKYMISHYIFCCYNSFDNSIKWKETKVAFEKIYKLIVSCEGYASSKDQKVRFQEALSKLSEEALERFKFHIGICRAEKTDSSMTDSQKASWYKKNRENIDFKQDYFNAIKGNTTLENAVKSF